MKSVFLRLELATSPVSGPKVEPLGKTPTLEGDLKLNPVFPDADELEGPEVAGKEAVDSRLVNSPALEVWGSPNVGNEEE